MKLALRYIPTEVWVDVFRYPGKSRKELGEIADKLGRKFAEYLQFYLHEWGKRTLDYLHLYYKDEFIPRTPIPENIKFFKKITIWHFDSSTIDFLHNISPLFNDVNLHFTGHWINNDLAKLRTIHGHLAPLLHGIHSLSFNQGTIPIVQQYFGPKLAQVKQLTLDLRHDPVAIQTSINFCLNWLVSEERDSTEPKFLKVWIRVAKNFQQFCIALQQQFLLAKSPCTFVIEFLYYGNNNPFTVFHLESNNLGEQLDGQFGEAAGCFQIYRHKVEDSAREQLQEWAKKTAEKSTNSSGIEFYDFTTIGKIEANDGAMQ